MKKKIGTITLTDLTFLSDPCYGTETWCNDVISTIPGEYNVFVTICESRNSWLKGRISSILAIHKDYTKSLKGMPKDNSEDIYCGVDSGTCGIFNAEYFEKFHDEQGVEDEWYDKNVIQMDDYNICDGLGAISSSGCGDGNYPVFAEYKGDSAFAIRIKFL